MPETLPSKKSPLVFGYFGNFVIVNSILFSCLEELSPLVELSFALQELTNIVNNNNIEGKILLNLFIESSFSLNNLIILIKILILCNKIKAKLKLIKHFLYNPTSQLSHTETKTQPPDTLNSHAQ